MPHHHSLPSSRRTAYFASCNLVRPMKSNPSCGKNARGCNVLNLLTIRQLSTAKRSAVLGAHCFVDAAAVRSGNLPCTCLWRRQGDKHLNRTAADGQAECIALRSASCGLFNLFALYTHTKITQRSAKPLQIPHIIIIGTSI